MVENKPIKAGDFIVTPLNEEAIAPVAIHHEIEEGYNFIQYEFEDGMSYCWARSYVDEIDTVAIFGPFKGREDITLVDVPEFREAVLDFLKRRFRKIDELGQDGYSTIWQA